MDAENDEVPPMQPAPDASARTSTSSENHNLDKIRRRNVPESAKKDSANDSGNRIPLVILPDSTKAWYDSVTPQISIDVDPSNKRQNGVMIRDEDDRDSNDNDSGAMDLFTSREKMKISVIRGSIAKPDLTLGELRLLGCSSEGFVNGTLSR